MSKILVIAEKPSVARDIAKTLECKNKGQGFLFSDKYIVSWAIGHLVTLWEPEDYNPSFKQWKINTLPIIPENIQLKPVNSTKAQLNILKKLLADKDVSSIICATDSGREGELIFRYIYTICKCKKPFKRLWISSMTDAAIKEGFANLKEGNEYDNLYYSAKCRSFSDWLVGINATRAYTIKYNTLLSIGRVQTPTLAILAERQREVDIFKPTDYWELKGLFDGYKGLWFDEKTKESKFYSKEKVEVIANKLKGKIGTIKSIHTEEKKQPPPLLYDLTELQRDCNRKFGFSAQKTLDIAQDLYEKRKLITYPRTDSRYLSDDMVPKLQTIISRLFQGKYEKECEYINNFETLPINKRIVDNSKVTDHHAIIPTEAKFSQANVSFDEGKVLDLISRRFISVFYSYYIYNITKITTDIENEKFITKGTVIKQLGWMELYKNDTSNEKTNDDYENQTLPNVNKGDSIALNDTEILQKKTQPPKLYNEASLLSAMENAGRFVEDEELKERLKDSGLGTPATRASIIERLLQVGYITRKGKTLVPTEKGMKLIEIVPLELKSPETTGKWEKGLASISKGKMEQEKFMDSINRYVNYIIKSSKTSPVDVVFPQEQQKSENKAAQTLSLGYCPKCQEGQILENSKGYYCTNWKSGCKFTIWKDSLKAHGIVITPKDIKNILKNGKAENIQFISPKNEKCICDFIFNTNKIIEIANLKKGENI